MPQITGFSPAVGQALRQFSFRTVRQATASAPVLVHSMRCGRCGFELEHNPPLETLATGIEDVEWTHELDWKTGKRCGGQMLFVTGGKA